MKKKMEVMVRNNGFDWPDKVPILEENNPVFQDEYIIHLIKFSTYLAFENIYKNVIGFSHSKIKESNFAYNVCNAMYGKYALDGSYNSYESTMLNGKFSYEEKVKNMIETWNRVWELFGYEKER